MGGLCLIHHHHHPPSSLSTRGAFALYHRLHHHRLCLSALVAHAGPVAAGSSDEADGIACRLERCVCRSVGRSRPRPSHAATRSSSLAAGGATTGARPTPPPESEGRFMPMSNSSSVIDMTVDGGLAAAA